MQPNNGLPATLDRSGVQERANTRRLLGALDRERAAPDLAKPTNRDSRVDGIREPRPSARNRRTAWPIAAAVLASALVAGGGMFAVMRSPVAAPAPNPPVKQGAAASTTAALQASGFVVATRQATVSSDVTGRLIAILVAEGSEVRRGQVLARLDPRIPNADIAFATAQVGAAQRNADVTRSRVGAADTVLGRREALASKGFVTRASLDEARYAKAAVVAQLAADGGAVTVARSQLARQRQQLSSAAIVAPFDGVVSAIAANIGEIVSPISAGGGFTRTGICTIVDLSSLVGEVDVSEQYLSQVSRGQKVRIRIPAYPKLRVMGHVTAITAAVNRGTAAVKVRVAFDRVLPEMLPGMRLDLEFVPRSTSPGDKPGN